MSDLSTTTVDRAVNRSQMAVSTTDVAIDIDPFMIFGEIAHYFAPLT